MLQRSLIALFVVFILGSCAKRGTITGGAKDTIAPILKMSFPKNGSTNYKGGLITLTFDEYVRTKDLNKQLIVSPPLDHLPEILPSTASKELTINIKDTLKPNTTYSFNFGQSIQDNNENNPIQQFKYVFSTGSYLDSLQLKGTIKDAFDRKVTNFVSIMLYEINSKYTDSVIYKKSPLYITNTLDSLKTFTFDHLKKGKYLLIALKDKNNNNKFDPADEKIGFQTKPITIPNDTVFELELFKEKRPLKIAKPKQQSGNSLLVPYEGMPKGGQFTLKNRDHTIPIVVTKMPQKDSLLIWHQPIKTDSLWISYEKESYKTSFKIRIKPEKRDTLNLESLQKGSLSFRDDLVLRSSTPIKKFDVSKMKLINKDSTQVSFKTEYDEWQQELKFVFKKEPLEKYTLWLEPGAITDLFDKNNSKSSFKVTTQNTSDYGNLSLILQNVHRFPVMVSLTDDSGAVKYTAYSDKDNRLEFNLIDPAKYTLRLIYDDNRNREWDAGHFLNKTQSEEVIYFPKLIDIRENWDVEQVFDLNQGEK
ncbi:hypothetical protein B0A58_03885 [Flavobacterium branchiophilum NBRC 15030 = ATCC 35035]|uniref:Ig-like domain-containing protein n=1 Tax=Flavobacterium branchiophilum TaxID=55197 RepID=A0A543G2J2_9FLAO|nr:Ig-like domain-containing protein [Flavobacterium branchiophilum]OXA79261.1 hypothetical protein B0A58_03885 [Flavobacterium branchiophilum NBRC 15030 = ATCC 35035]TQM40244.1 Ig-like domain-containing protein [Flavobacterium branchiophilum]GEM53943.1 hypothetical protein FB1_01640 [Flavobacterium branchiophilum NBRC 15030 = ATCC 35035]